MNFFNVKIAELVYQITEHQSVLVLNCFGDYILAVKIRIEFVQVCSRSFATIDLT